MTNKFKVGDKVKVIANKYGSQNLVGDIGIVTEINGKSIAVKVKGRPNRSNWHNESELKTVESKPTKNQRISKLEEEVAELKLIVAQIRKPSTVVEEALANDVIEFEGKQYKKVDREAREGDVIIYSEIGSGWMNISANKPYKVFEDDVVGQTKLLFTRDNGHPCRVYGECKGFNEVGAKNINVYELIVEDKPKTPNQLRAEIIEKAKGFVEKIKIERTVNHKKALVYVNRKTLNWVNAEFIVNEDKRTVVCLIRWTKDNSIDGRGIAKCMPGDVFNVWIGKAIALGRALGLDVSEFEQAVQPDEVVVGMVVKSSYDGEIFELSSVRESAIGMFDCVKAFNIKNKKTWIGDNQISEIINDTNAQYGGVE